MFYIIESQEQLKRLKVYKDFGCFLELIESNDLYHPKLTEVVAVYIRPVIDKGQGYIVPINHDEGLNQNFDDVCKVLRSFTKVYVLNKKRTLYHYIGKQELIDLNLKEAMLRFDRLDTETSVKTYNWFYSKYGHLANVNQIIPLTKHYERCEELYSRVEGLIKEEEPAGFQFYNETATKVYFMVEQSGMRVDTWGFLKNFKLNNEGYSLDGETVYTSYNLCNPTSRPTNAFNGVNFLAIPKGQEFRQCFKSRFGKEGMFVQFDWDGYHLRLVSEQIGYKLKLDEKAHLQLAKLWYGKDEISDVEYGKAKAMNFQIIYGAIPEEYRGLEFTDKVQTYIDELWKQYRKDGYVTNPVSGKQFTKNLKDMKPNKLMNYMVQSLETARNVEVLCKVLRMLNKNQYKSKVILITYDSFLVDWSYEDGEEVLTEIKKIMEGKGGQYPVSEDRSLDLNF